MPTLLPQEVIRAKRDGATLDAAQIAAFVRGLASDAEHERWSEGQCAALAMAIVCRGMDAAETALLTAAMAASGERLDWRTAGFDAPVLDKHSTGGVGDKVSLVLAPIVAACGGLVPMVSGRGLAHTGGTLDKLEALPGYIVTPPPEALHRALREAGCAIVGASGRLAPADARLYAIRDVTATVESVPLITASILSKKLAAGVQALVMDVKAGSGAFCSTLEEAKVLATSLVRVAAEAGLPARARITDMNQVLGTTAGNALEVREALDVLTAGAGGDGGTGDDARFRQLTLELSSCLLVAGGLAADHEEALQRATSALDSGHAAERFARMVAALGGPADVLGMASLPVAPVQRELVAERAGFVSFIDVRAVGLAIVGLGGGRRVAGDTIDPRVGLSHIRALGTRVAAGDVLLRVHAASDEAAAAALAALRATITIGDVAPAVPPLIHASVEA